LIVVAHTDQMLYNIFSGYVVLRIYFVTNVH